MTSPKHHDWKSDAGRFLAMVTQFFPFWVAAVVGLVTATLFPLLGCRRGPAEVVVYASQDQVYAEPILKEFEKQSGIRVRAVFDSEAVKTVGLANRLLAERGRPQCDVFWNNEELRTRQLAAQNVFRETNAWAAIGYRSRRLVINTNRLDPAAAPPGLLDLTSAAWRGKVALAYPLFGTTATHFLALRQRWGDAGWRAWCRALASNQPFVVDGNSVVVQFVARGEALVGLTDSDDIAAAQREGAPVAALPLFPESLLIPNTVAVVRQAPHPAAAQRLFDYLQRRDVLARLISAHALEGAGPEAVSHVVVQPQWDDLLRDLDTATRTLQETFRR